MTVRGSARGTAASATTAAAALARSTRTCLLCWRFVTSSAFFCRAHLSVTSRSAPATAHPTARNYLTTAFFSDHAGGDRHRIAGRRRRKRVSLALSDAAVCQALNLALWLAQVQQRSHQPSLALTAHASPQDLLRFMNVWVQFVVMVVRHAADRVFAALDSVFAVAGVGGPDGGRFIRQHVLPAAQSQGHSCQRQVSYSACSHVYALWPLRCG